MIGSHKSVNPKLANVGHHVSSSLGFIPNSTASDEHEVCNRSALAFDGQLKPFKRSHTYAPATPRTAWETVIMLCAVSRVFVCSVSPDPGEVYVLQSRAASEVSRVLDIPFISSSCREDGGESHIPPIY